MSKTIAQTYKLLDEIAHIRQRTGMYAGSTTPETEVKWVFNPETKKMELRELTVVPAFIKIVSEIIDNAIDESRRAPMESIRIRFHKEADGTFQAIEVTDSGRGIPVEIHPDTITPDFPKGKYVAEAVFSNLRAGSNFDDEEDQSLIGTNGVGATLTNVLSTSFKIESCDGKKMFKQEFTGGMRERGEPKVSNDDRHYTKITFVPDYQFFKMGVEGAYALDEDSRLAIIKKVVDAAATNPKVKFYIDGDRVLTQKFGDYIAMYADEYVYDENENWKVGVSYADEHDVISFVNSVETYKGGSHVTYVTNQIVDGLREMIKKKFKVEVSPGDVRAHMRIYISATVNRPRFSSQTKENMISPVSEWKTNWSVPEKFLRRVFDSEIIESVMDRVRAKAEAELQKELRKAGKESNKFDPRKVDKFSDAMERNERQKCVLFLAEGDSAAKSIQGGRGKNPYIASFPLKGKPLNVREKEIIRVLGLDKKKEKEAAGKKVEPNEIQKILTIIGLQIGVKVNSLSELRFGKLAIASDADVDGYHICGLLMNLFDTFWPELLKMGFVHILRTPVVLVTMKDKTEKEFFVERDFHEWEKSEGSKLKGWTFKYYKGLSAWKTPQFASFLANLDQYLFKVTMEEAEDKDAIDLAFNNARADDRKTWLETPAADFEEFIVEALESV